MGFPAAFLLSILASVPASALASDCNFIRLDRGDGIMAGVPTRDQADIGICYAVVASQLYDAYRKAHPSPIDKVLGPTTSSVYAATQHALDPASFKLRCPKIEPDADRRDFLIEAGSNCGTFNVMVNEGACSADTVNSLFFGTYEELMASRQRELTTARKALRDKIEQLQFFKTGRKFNNSKERAADLSMTQALVEGAKIRVKKAEAAVAAGNKDYKDWPQLRAYSLSKVYNQDLLEAACKKLESPEGCRSSLTEALAPGESPEFLKLKEEIKVLAGAALRDFKAVMDKHACSPSAAKLTPAPGTCGPTCKEERSDLETISKELHKPGALPVGLSLCSAILTSPDQVNLWKKKDPNFRVPANLDWRASSKCGWHAVLVIGQQKNPTSGRCELLIRNSHGGRCETSCKGTLCRCDPETGVLFVDAELAMKNAGSLSIIREKAPCQ